MSKMSELDLVLVELKKCGESLVSISGELREIFSGSGDASAEKPKAAKKKSEKEAAAAQEPEAKAEKQYSLAEVRAVLAEKAKAGHTVAVKDILLKHGADKLSGIDPSEYAALVAEVEVLGNG